MTSRKFPLLFAKENDPDVLKQIIDVLVEIISVREEDIGDFDNLQSIFMRGRKVGKTPSSSADVADTDREGDFNYSTSFFYLAVNNAGTLVWRRIALSSW